MRYYTHIELPDNIKTPIQEIHRKYFTDNRSEPHITLVEPRELSEGVTCGELKQVLKRICGKTAPIEIKIGEVGYFGNKNLIYLSVVRSKELSNCYAKLSLTTMSMLELSGKNYGFSTPHITLASGFQQDKADDILEELKSMNWKGYGFLCSHIVLLGKKNDAKWQIIERFQLGG